jgi:hypothetical protein
MHRVEDSVGQKTELRFPMVGEIVKVVTKEGKGESVTWPSTSR